MVKDAATTPAARKAPKRSERSPEANGRSFLKGWRRSVSRSSRSLMIYTPDAQRQKQAKASRTLGRCWKWRVWHVGTNTSRFFTQW